MAEYRLTKKGKIVLSIFSFVLLVGMTMSAYYIVQHLTKLDESAVISSDVEFIDATNNEEPSEVIKTTETSTETTTETTTEIANVEISEDTNSESNSHLTSKSGNHDTIYTKEQLAELKQFKLIVYYDVDSNLNSLSKEDRDTLLLLLKRYPDEEIAVAGFVNGYPDFNDTEKRQQLSQEMASSMSQSIINLGFKSSMIKIYALGANNPLTIEDKNQDLNNRVEIYFLNHYLGMKHTK